MGSYIVFYNFYLDRCLRSGWYLDIVTLLLLRDAFLMIRFFSVVFRLPGSRVWWGMIRCHLFFFTCHTSDAILGHIPFRMTFTDFHWVVRSSLLVRCVPRRWLVRHFYDGSLVETLGRHPVRFALLDIPMSPCFPLWDALLDAWTQFCHRFGWPRSYVR